MFCRLIRWLIDRHLDGQQILPGFVPRHLSRCPACRRYQAASRELIDELTVVADTASPPSPELRSRILAQVAGMGGSAFSPSPVRPGRRLIHAAAAAAVAAAALAIIAVIAAMVLRSESRPEAPQPKIVTPAPALPPIEPAVAIDGSSRAIDEFAGQMCDKQLDALFNDALAVGRGLVDSLPVDLAPLVPAEQAKP